MLTPVREAERCWRYRWRRWAGTWKEISLCSSYIKMEQEHRRRKKVLWQARLRPERVITALHVWRRKEVAVCVCGVCVCVWWSLWRHPGDTHPLPFSPNCQLCISTCLWRKRKGDQTVCSTQLPARTHNDDVRPAGLMGLEPRCPIDLDVKSPNGELICCFN